MKTVKGAQSALRTVLCAKHPRNSSGCVQEQGRPEVKQGTLLLETTTMSTTIAQAGSDRDASAAANTTENQSPNCTKAALRSVMKTASKSLRVPADFDESSPTPVRVLRNGKKVRATPRLPKASRVTISPEDTMALGGAHRIPFTQVQENPATPPTEPRIAPDIAPSPFSGNQQLGSATPQDSFSKDAPLTPTAVISSMQQLQLAEDTPESLLLCEEVLADSSSGTMQAPEEITGAESFSAQPSVPADDRVDEKCPEPLTAAHTPEAAPQAAASARTPQHHADAAPGFVSAETSTATAQPATYESTAPAAVPVRTSEHGPHASGERPLMKTPTPAGAAHPAEGHAVASLQTPLPEPSPELPGQSDLVTPPPQVLNDVETPDVDASHPMQHDTPDEEPEGTTQQEAACVETDTAEVSSFIPRGKRTPFMERKLRALQAKEWADQDAGKVHKSRLEREKDAAAAARKDSLSSADRAATRRLVRRTFAKAVETQGKDLGQTMVRHKSRLQREKEAVAAAAESALPGSTGPARQRRSPAGSSFAGQGLGDMKTHMGRLEKARAAAAAKKAAGSASPAVESRLPSYMRQTAASAAMQKEGGLGENMKVHKSQLERDRETALALQAARKKSGHNPLTPYPTKRGSVAKPRLSFGSLGGGPAHKSKLERAKEAATAAAAAADAPALTSRPPKSTLSSRGAAAPGTGLGDLKPHKSRLQREKEAWARQASAEDAPRRAGAAAPTVLQARNINTPPQPHGPQTQSLKGEAGRREGFSDFVPN